MMRMKVRMRVRVRRVRAVSLVTWILRADTNSSEYFLRASSYMISVRLTSDDVGFIAEGM